MEFDQTERDIPRSLLKKNFHDTNIKRRTPKEKILMLERIAILIIKKKKRKEQRKNTQNKKIPALKKQRGNMKKKKRLKHEYYQQKFQTKTRIKDTPVMKETV